MTQKFLKVIFFLFFILVFISNAYAFKVSDSPNYYSSVETIPSTYKDPCPQPCGNVVADECWNGSTPGVKVSCGATCVRGGGEAQRSWTRYVYKESTCRYDPDLSFALGDTVCTPIYTISGDTCSTADKYNGSPDFPGGNLTEMKYGSCSCSAGNIYKTCCNGTTPAETYNYTAAGGGGNPDHPDAGCSYTTVACEVPSCDPFIGSPTRCINPSVQCGQAACAQLGTPTPTPGETCTAGQACTGTGGCSGQTTCPNGQNGTPVCSCFYSCTGANQSCVANPNGTYTTSNCNNACPTPPPISGTCAYPNTWVCPSGCIGTFGAAGWNCINTTTATYCSGGYCQSQTCPVGTTKVDCSTINFCNAP